MDEFHFGEGELVLMESIVKDDDTGCILIMLANTTNTTIRVHKGEKVKGAIPAIIKVEILAPHMHKGSILMIYKGQ